MLVAPACGGDDEPAEGVAPATAPGAVATVADPAPGRVLTAFLRAARRGDTGALWSMLSRPSRAGFGGSEDAFRGDGGRELVSWLGPVPRARLELSLRVGERWAVAAVAGERLVEDDVEDFAWAVALRRESATWRVELGGIVVGGVRPEPLEEAEPDTELRADVAAGGRVRSFLLWLDGRALQAASESDMAFAGRVRARPGSPLAPGRHVGVAFAATESAAGAVAWPFRIE